MRLSLAGRMLGCRLDMKPFEHTGFWWDPRDPDTRWPGTLRFDPVTGAVLTRTIAFHPSHLLPAGREFDILLGDTTTSGSVTLLGEATPWSAHEGASSHQGRHLTCSRSFTWTATACGALWAARSRRRPRTCGKRVGAFSMGPARSIGRCREPDRDHAHTFALPPRRVPGSRIVGPFSVSRCA